MKFGKVRLADAVGGILAHTHRLPTKGVLKKGRVLDVDDVRRLEAAGFHEIVVATLGPCDVSEDEAAARLAAPACGAGVRMGEAATGRANLYAERRGLLDFDPAQLDAVNLVDEALTVGVLPRRSVVEANTMVGTVKVIPFAVPEALVERCRAAISDLLTVRAFVPRRAGLVMTELPGVHDRQLERAAHAQQVRIRYLGGKVVRTTRCEHTERDVADAVRRMHDEGLNPILVLGASAIVDRGDVVPQGIVQAGGELVHMGMPVDPGNLMLLARCGQSDVIGVPGCARSLKPSGYDWVLQRLAAGLAVTRQDIMRMGAGGLLTEMKGRPWPRGATDEMNAVKKVVGIVLAGGQSRRMGRANKLLVDIDGQPMVARVVRTLVDAGLDRVVVVTGHEADRVQAALSGFERLDFVPNPAYAEGLSTSLKAGIRALDTDVDGALVALGDMPWVRVGHVRKLLEGFDPNGICVPIHDRKRGHPVLWGSRFFAEFEKLDGDVGARHLLEQHADEVRLVPVDDVGVHVDVDTPEALEQLRRDWPTPKQGQTDV